MTQKPMRLGVDITEKEVEHACDQLMQSLGWIVVRFSQPRNTMQSPGIPDRRYYPPTLPFEYTGPQARAMMAAAPCRGPNSLYGNITRSEHAAFWLECKRPGGKQSEHQKAFEIRCKSVGEDYVLGGIPELVQYLNDSGIQKMKLHA